jgi:hypothetical protein
VDEYNKLVHGIQKADYTELMEQQLEKTRG